MERTQIESKMILNIKEKIKLGKHNVLNKFWEEVKRKGTPFIEKIDGDIDNALVTFVYKGNEKIENIVFIPPVGRNDFLLNRMERVYETNLWYISYKVRNDIRFKYAFSINDSLDINCNKRWNNLVHDKFNNNRLVFKDENGEVDEIDSYVVMPNADKHFWVTKRNFIFKGKIHEHQLHSKKLEKSRRIRVYTPHGYRKDNKPYKLLVLTDGNEYINILSAVAVLNNLIADKKIPPMVAVFIDSTETREEELSCNDAFGNIIVYDLIPWVKENYNISNIADETIVGGSSMGGLTAAYLGLKHSEIFGNILSQSGSYWYKPDNFEGSEIDCWISTQFMKIEKLPLKFYLNVGVLEHKEGMIGTNTILRDVLLSKGYSVDFENFKSGHDYLCWGETLASGLISLVGYK